MEKEHENIKQQSVIVRQKKFPFLVKAASLLLIVYGLIGLGYYLFTTIYSIGNPEFLKDLEYSGVEGNYLFVSLSIEILVHAFFVIAGFLIIKGKKRGMYYFYLGYIIAIGYTTFFLGSFSPIEAGMGLLIVLLLLLYKKRFQWQHS